MLNSMTGLLEMMRLPMTKPVLLYNQSELRNRRGILGLTELITNLINSDLFQIGNHSEKLSAPRSECSATLFYEGKKILLDVWEYDNPAWTEEAYACNYDLIIKLQHKTMSDSYLKMKCDKKKILPKLSDLEKQQHRDKIVTWTFFPSKLMDKYVDVNLPIERKGYFCGKFWKCRHQYKEKLIQNGFDFVESYRDPECKEPIIVPDDEYLHKMMTSKFGIVLAGRSSHLTDAKNRREIDYMIMKKPLLINYKPNYYNKLIEGVHYIYFDLTTDLSKLDQQYDLTQIANNAYEWYLKNATPIGSANVFMQIMKEKFG